MSHNMGKENVEIAELEKTSLWIQQSEEEGQEERDTDKMPAVWIGQSNEYQQMDALLELIDHPWFERFYKEFLWGIVEWLTSQICWRDSKQAKENNKPVYSFNDLKRNLRAIFVVMLQEPLNAIKEIQVMCKPENAEMLEKWIEWLTKLIKK